MRMFCLLVSGSGMKHLQCKAVYGYVQAETDPSKFTSMQDYADGYPKAFVTRRLVTFIGIVIG